jgi:hypothetical protein
MKKRHLVIGFALVIVGQLAAAQAQAQTQTKRISNTYAARFTCGVQLQSIITADPDVQAGRYSTKIGVHNNTGVTITCRKKIIRLLGSGAPTPEMPTDPANQKPLDVLTEDQALEVVCKDIYKILNITPVPPDPWPYINGFVIFEVYGVSGQRVPPPDPLDVEGIYTYKGDLTNNPGADGISIAVVVYPAKSNGHILH